MARAEDSPKPPPAKRPRHSARTAADKAARASRVAAEMRMNLLKRKARQRAERDRSKPD